MMVDRRNDSKAQVEGFQMTNLVPIGMRRPGSCEKAERHGHDPAFRRSNFGFLHLSESPLMARKRSLPMSVLAPLTGVDRTSIRPVEFDMNDPIRT